MNLENPTFERWWNDWIRRRREKSLPKKPAANTIKQKPPVAPTPAAQIEERATPVSTRHRAIPR